MSIGKESKNTIRDSNQRCLVLYGTDNMTAEYNSLLMTLSSKLSSPTNSLPHSGFIIPKMNSSATSMLVARILIYDMNASPLSAVFDRKKIRRTVASKCT